eukprot:scaffold195901_cov36-Attheya_sp.AAC.1
MPPSQQNVLDKQQKQYERKLARQKQLEAMEAAAGGSVRAIVPSSNDTMSSSSAPGGPGSGRKQMWDDNDDSEYGTPPAPQMFGSTPPSNPEGRHMLVASKEASSSSSNKSSSDDGGGGFLGNMLGRLGVSGRNPEDNDYNHSVMHQSDAGSLDHMDDDFLEEDLELNGRRKNRRNGPVKKASHAVSGRVEGFQVWLKSTWNTHCSSRRLSVCFMSTLLIVIFLLFVDDVVEIYQNRGHGGAPDGSASSGKKSVKTDMVRFNEARSVILVSRFSSEKDLDEADTPQNKALNWIVTWDPASLPTDHDMLVQRYALAVFFFSTYDASEQVEEHEDTQDPNQLVQQGKGWTRTENWMTAKGICLWAGISCMPHLRNGVEEYQYNENNAVMFFNLTNNNIKGTIPHEIAALEDLTTFDLSKNHLHGSVPYELGNLENVVDIYLIANQLTGSIPPSLGSCAKLRNLYMGSNQITGQIPSEIMGLQQLRALGLDDNKLEGTLPNSIANLKKLSELVVQLKYI